MTIAAPPRRRRGWRPTPERPYPSLGWQILDWTYAYLPSPANEKEPLVYTDEQARRIVEWFRIDPRTGRYVYNRRLHLQEAKGFGKSPFAGSLDIVDFAGPVCFDGWDANGEPVGVPWGTGDRPPPWIQVAAVSIGQTRNTWSALYAMLTANDRRAAELLRIDAGLTRCHLMDQSEAILEPVTASAGSREGQRVTKATLDEPQLWTPASGGHNLARTILGNLTKMGGRAVFTGNAYTEGENSVAELFDVDEPGVLRYGRRPSEEPERDWPRPKLIASLREVYGDSTWIDLDRIVDDATSETADWARSRRLFWNLPTSGSSTRWIPDQIWEDAEGEPELDRRLPTYIAVFVAPGLGSAAIATAQQLDGLIALKVRTFPGDGEELDEDDEELVSFADLERYIAGLRERFPAYVVGVRRFQGRERKVPMRGPEIAYNGAYFEGSAQRLRRDRAATVNEQQTRKRLSDAGGSLRTAVFEQRLVHDGGDTLARQIAGVRAEETETGWIIEQAGPAARAAMVAVHRAMTAPKAPARTMRRGKPI